MVSLHTTEKESHSCLPLHARPLSDPRITLFLRRVVKTKEKQERVRKFSEQRCGETQQ